MNVSFVYLSHGDVFSDLDSNGISSKYYMYKLANTDDNGDPIASPSCWYMSMHTAVWLKSPSKAHHLEVVGSIPTTSKLQGILTIACIQSSLIELGLLRGLSKGFCSKFCMGSRVWWKKSEVHVDQNIVLNNEDEHNSPNILSNKNYVTHVGPATFF